MNKLKLVMVGNGMAGVRTLEELLRLAPDLYEITVFGAEPHPNYNRILLSPVLAGEQTLEQIVLNSREWYAENGITLLTGTRVVGVHRKARLVQTDDGREIEYDRLLIATGSNPFLLPVPGKDLPGVIAYRDIADTQAMIDAAASFKHAVVIGGSEVDQPFFPPAQVHLIADYTLPVLGLRLSPEVSWISARMSSQSNALQNAGAYELPAYLYTAVSLSMPEQKLLGNRPTAVSLRVTNLLDTRYAEPGYGGIDIPAQGRTVFLTLTQGI